MNDLADGLDTVVSFPDFTTSPDTITSSSIARLVAYWHGCSIDGRVPLRADIDPAAIKDLLPNIVLTEIDAAFRVRYRLVGTRVVEFNKLDFTGAYLDDMRWDVTERYSRAYRRVAETGLPHYGIDSWPLARNLHGRSEVVMLPLSTDGSRVDRCLSMEDFLFASHDLPVG
ncbi:PAS domain-containing protein [Dongia rigui]|uniref:PAS domain-containing protein n=1 Tax=Dongia rigui TaxID=940149 RepID=A0ABU5DYN7_9PROT|nr:PAS domain-containing protein [Dongia rigui]MDY0872442.1 PAS domain-containing protein [Dongia rigui]